MRHNFKGRSNNYVRQSGHMKRRKKRLFILGVIMVVCLGFGSIQVYSYTKGKNSKDEDSLPTISEGEGDSKWEDDKDTSLSQNDGIKEDKNDPNAEEDNNGSNVEEDKNDPVKEEDKNDSVPEEDKDTSESENDKDSSVIDKDKDKDNETSDKKDDSSSSNVDADANSKDTDQDGTAVIIEDYDYSKSVPKSDVVDLSYFNDAVFIGDSRTEGFILNAGMSNTISFAKKGLMVDSVFTSPVININDEKLTVIEALEKTTFSKVYIMLGINETGWVYSSAFINKYSEIIDEIQRINPEAMIYVQSILPVSKKVSSTHDYLKNSKIEEYNNLLKKMTKEKNIFYVNVAEAVMGSDGNLPEEAATDGIHLKKDYCEKWLEYLKTHTVTE